MIPIAKAGNLHLFTPDTAHTCACNQSMLVRQMTAPTHLQKRGCAQLRGAHACMACPHTQAALHRRTIRLITHSGTTLQTTRKGWRRRPDPAWTPCPSSSSSCPARQHARGALSPAGPAHRAVHLTVVGAAQAALPVAALTARPGHPAKCMQSQEARHQDARRWRPATMHARSTLPPSHPCGPETCAVKAAARHRFVATYMHVAPHACSSR